MCRILSFAYFFLFGMFLGRAGVCLHAWCPWQSLLSASAAAASLCLAVYFGRRAAEEEGK